MVLRGFLLSFLLSLTALSGGVKLVYAADLTEIVSEADKSMGRVILASDGMVLGTGSGFVIGWDGDGNAVFLTNHHVASAGPDILVFFRNGGSGVAGFTGRVIASSAERDMAALVLFPQDTGGFLPSVLPLSVREIAKGETVAALGYPGTSDMVVADSDNIALFDTTLTQGLVSKVFVSRWAESSADEELEIVQHTATINHGNSGGPLLDECGQAVGMNTAGLLDGAGTYLASSSRSIAEFLDRAQISYRASTTKCGAAAEPEFTTEPVAEVADATVREASEPLVPQVVRDALWQNVLLTAGIGLLLVLVIALAVFASRRSGGAARPGAGATAVVLVLQSATAGWSARRPLTTAALRKGIVLGRGGDADVDVEVAGISRQHARLRIENRKLMLSDLGSTNGTTVDGEPLPEGRARQVNSDSAVVLAGLVTVQLRRC